MVRADSELHFGEEQWRQGPALLHERPVHDAHILVGLRPRGVKQEQAAVHAGRQHTRQVLRRQDQDDIQYQHL
jgi:hypothetical protein